MRRGPRVIRIAVLASGRGSNLEALFEALSGRADAAIVLVASDRADAPALGRAQARGVAAAVVAPDDAAGMIDVMERSRVDWIVLAGYLKRVPPEVVRKYRGRILNIHPALLPRHGGKGMYGERVHAAVLAAGESRSGASVHLVDEEYDRGPVVAQRPVPVLPDDTPASLAARVLEVEHRLLPEVVVAVAEGRLRVEGDRAWIEEPANR
ncbi:MAG TPA: phosphoribosylglycinamide formyltransferase [Gemmatimonadota bacterium]|nr:phosphoribosylglycinamide formyltransferase [Gemmatimonadota bacterium]